MTAYAAIENPTDWNLKKNAWRNWRLRKRQNHVTIKNCRSLPPHTDINDATQQDGNPHTAIQQ